MLRHRAGKALQAVLDAGLNVTRGVAEWDGTETGIELFARADRALYEVKRQGRDRTIEAGAAPALLSA